MQNSEIETAGTKLRVEFYPSVDDYVYMAERVNESIPTSSIHLYLYQAFLLINIIAFPAFLWKMDYLTSGILVFAVNLAVVIFITPRYNRAFFQRHYNQLLGDREKHVAVVELSSDGLRYAHDNTDTFYSWRKFNLIEETDESIFFFYPGHGFGVRKSGFAYEEEKNEFVNFARQQLALVKN